MTEYINKEEFKKRINDMIREGIIDKDDTKVILCDFVLKLINGFPTADVQEVKHGHWVKNTHKADISFLFDEKEFYNALNERLNYRANHTENEYFEHFATFTCSICGAKSYKTTPYCAECGAEMEE